MQRGAPTSDRIGPYRVIRRLSVNGPVQVLLAKEDGPAGFLRNVMLKVVPDVTGAGAKDIEELVHDATACAKLTHPAIVRTRRVFHQDGALILVVEGVEGISLATLLSTRMTEGERLVSDDAACHIASSICDALAHAHTMNDDAGAASPILHRAVSPSNVLLARDGSVKLDGFGFAQIAGGVAVDRTGSSAWTPAYMAPEQVTAQAPTSKVDVYSAGLILWELLTGRSATTLPENPLAIAATLRAVADRKPESLAKLRPDLPQDLIATIDAALVSSPEGRTISCADMSRSIRKAARADAGKRELRERVIRALSVESATRLPALPRHATVPPPPRVAPADRIAAAAALVPPPRAEATTLVPLGDEAAPDSADWSTSVPLPSLASRLRARVSSRRHAWMAAGAALSLGVAGLVAMLVRSHPPATSAVAVAKDPDPAAAVVAGVETARPTAASAQSNDEMASPGEISDDLVQRGLAYLTVHSAATRANVYVNLKLYGAIEDKLTVPCGNRFVSIGAPGSRAAEPLWLAPGQKMVIPCGASFEVTMNPRALR